MPRVTAPKLLPLLIFSSLLSWSTAQDIPPNPCPDVFSYVKNSRGDIVGRITLPNNGEGYINVEVNVSLATNTDNPKVTLERVEQDLTDCKPSIFHLYLPFTNNIPRITRIWFNGNQLCSGPKEPLIAGGRTVWNLWRQSSYETSQRFSCRSSRPIQTTQPPSSVGLFFNIGNVDFNQPSALPTFTTGDNANSADFSTALQNALSRLPTASSSSLDNNPFLVGRFPSLNVDPTAAPPPFRPPVTRPATPPWSEPPRAPTGGAANQCGISAGRSRVTNLSFGGEDVPAGEFPWMAALMYRKEATRITFTCTVTLITLRHVITTGHCIDLNAGEIAAPLQKEHLLVVLGTSDIANWFEDSVVRSVSNIYLKPGIKDGRAEHDVALLQMQRNVVYTPGKVVPICIWSDSNEKDLAKLIDLNPGTVVGFGATKTSNTRLNKIEVPVIAHLTCLHSSSFPTDLVATNTFCGGYIDGQMGTCETDAGSSFCVQKDKGGPWFLRGILSITPSVSATECNLKGYSLYVDLAEHYRWIYNLIARDGF